MASFGDRPTYEGRRDPITDTLKCVNGEEHVWVPLTFALETTQRTTMDDIPTRTPWAIDARVYCVCMGCRSWTWLGADWVGFWLGGPEKVDPTLDEHGRYKPWLEGRDLPDHE